MDMEITNVKSYFLGKIRQEGQDGPVLLTWLPDKFESIGLSVHKSSILIFKMVAILDFQSVWF